MVQTLHDYKLVCPAYLLLTEGAICERCRGGRYWQAVRHRCLLDSRGASLVATAEAYLAPLARDLRHAWPASSARAGSSWRRWPRSGCRGSGWSTCPYFLPLERYRPAPVPARRGRRAGDAASTSGRLSREKGVATLVDAMAALPRGNGCGWRSSGEGPLREELEATGAARLSRRADPLPRLPQRATRCTTRSGSASFAVVP